MILMARSVRSSASNDWCRLLASMSAGVIDNVMERGARDEATRHVYIGELER